MKKKSISLSILTAVMLLVTVCLSADSSSSDYISSKIAAVMQEAYDSNPELSIGARSCMVGSFPWEESGIGTAFSRYLRREAEAAIMAVEAFDLVTLPENTPIFGDEANRMLAEESDSLPDAAYRLYGNYRIEDGAVELRMRLYSMVFSRLMEEMAVQLPLTELPKGIALYPHNRELVSDISSQVSKLYSGASQFQVFLTTNRGEGGVFTEGEYLKLYLLASSNCYVKIYHIDVNGNASLIFPNRFERDNYLPGRQILEFPGKQSPFQFKLVAPYGVEIIKVVASDRQFSSVERDFADLGEASRGIFLEEADEEATEVMAESMVHFTIIEQESN